MMKETFMSDVSEEVEEEEDEGTCEPAATFLSLLEGIDSERKYLIKFDVHDNMMVALSTTESRVHQPQQKVKK